MANLISPAVGRITSGYGPRKSTIPGMTTFHRGVDISDVDDAIVAASNGTVVDSRWNSIRGNYVRINIGGGVTILVQHLSSRGVHVGDRVVAGQWLGREGRTGVATGTHCHIEVAINGVNVNPSDWFAHHGVVLGSLGTGVWVPPVAHPPTSDTLAYQQRNNRYGAAGLKEDGIDGPQTKMWRQWVHQAQEELNKWRSANPDIPVDGDYGLKTHARTRELQSRNGLPVTGILSNSDIAYMHKYGSKLPSRP